MTVKIFTVAQMVAAEKEADAAGLSYEQMMENAGRGLAQAIMARSAVAGKQILVLVGPGNNGGDGLVAGRYLAEAGAQLSFYLSRPRDAAQDHNFARLAPLGLEQAGAQQDPGYRLLRRRLRAADIIVDALLGTGVSRPISGDMAHLMRAVQAEIETRRAAGPAAPLLIVAVDCPSGLNCDTGDLDPLATAAELTVTFAGPKRGHFIFPGAAAVGQLQVVDIGIDPQLEAVRRVPVVLATAQWARAHLPPRPPDGHKGTFGKVLLVAGSASYWGAPILCGRGAYRAGSGLVALAVPQQARAVAAGQLPEAIFPPVPDTDNWSEQGARFVAQIAPDYDALLLGPGMGPAAEPFLEALLASGASLPPLVVDADGLNGLARMAQGPARLPPGSLLTPHPGEMARLLGASVAGPDRLKLAQESAARWQQVLLLKGAFTVVAEPGGRCLLLPFANPLLGSAGSGDVLAGVAASLLGQGLPAFEAAALAAYLHGVAGELAREQLGDAGLLSSELADWLPHARQRLAAQA